MIPPGGAWRSHPVYQGKGQEHLDPAGVGAANDRIWFTKGCEEEGHALVDTNVHPLVHLLHIFFMRHNREIHAEGARRQPLDEPQAFAEIVTVEMRERNWLHHPECTGLRHRRNKLRVGTRVHLGVERCGLVVASGGELHAPGRISLGPERRCPGETALRHDSAAFLIILNKRATVWLWRGGVNTFQVRASAESSCCRCFVIKETRSECIGQGQPAKNYRGGSKA